jgi:hypothetical protein
MKFMKFVILLVFGISLLLIVFCFSKTVDGIFKAEASIEGKIPEAPRGQVKEKELQLRAAHVFGEIERLLHYNFGHLAWDRMGLLLAEQGSVLYVDRGPISGKEDIANFFRDNSKGQSLEIELKKIGPYRMIEAVVNGYEIDMLCSVEFEFHLSIKEGNKILKNQTISSDMFLFHRNIR